DFGDRVLMDDRPGEVTGVKRFAHAKTSSHADKLVGELIDDLFMNDNSASRDTALTTRLESAQNAAGDSQIHPSIGAYNDRALAAHFASDNAVIMLGRELLNAMTDIIAPGKEHHVDAGISY